MDVWKYEIISLYYYILVNTRNKFHTSAHHVLFFLYIILNYWLMSWFYFLKKLYVVFINHS